jgi:hypothetical protein
MKPTPATGKSHGAGVDGIQWTGDAIVMGNHTYVYGFTLAEKNPFVTHYSYVARVPNRDIENPEAWRFYKKSTNEWVTSTSELSDDAVNQPDAIVASQVSSARVINGKVVLVHKPWNELGEEVFAEIGTEPQGPFIQRSLFRSPAGQFESENYQTYAPMLHPEQDIFGADDDTVLISINWNGKDFFADVIPNADLYKPRFDAVDLGIA